MFDVELLFSYTVPGAPVPWARHSGSGPGAYTKPRQKAHKRALSQFAWVSKGCPRVKPIADRPIMLVGRFYIPGPAKRTADLAAAIAAETCMDMRRPDIDNWLKLPMDALNGIVWADDSQVISHGNSGKFLSDRPRTELEIYLITGPAYVRGGDLAHGE